MNDLSVYRMAGNEIQVWGPESDIKRPFVEQMRACIGLRFPVIDGDKSIVLADYVIIGPSLRKQEK